MQTHLHRQESIGTSNHHRPAFSGCVLATNVAYISGSGPIARRQDLALEESIDYRALSVAGAAKEDDLHFTSLNYLQNLCHSNSGQAPRAFQLWACCLLS